MPRRALLILVACAACAVAVSSAPAHRLPQAPRCPILPASNPFNQRVDRLPVASDSATLVASIGADGTAKADFGSGLYDGGPIGIPYNVVRGAQRRVPVSFEYADESDGTRYPIPRGTPIEGGANADGDRHVLLVDRDRCRLYELHDAHPLDGGARWRAGSGAIFDLRSNRLRPAGWTSADAAGLPILPASRATARSPGDRSTTRCASPRAARAARTSTPRATSRRATAIPRWRRWACACA
jgi:hypothetical protein